MADKINGLPGSIQHSPARQKPADENARPGSAESGEAGRAQTGSDSVHLTDSARRLNSLTEQVAAAEPVDSSRVEAVRQALDDGSYQVDAEKLAGKLMAFDRLLED